MAFLGHLLWAQPVAFNPAPKFCGECKREDVGYLQPGDLVCANCTERLERDRVLTEQRALEAQPGYRISEATAKEKARLLNRVERPKTSIPGSSEFRAPEPDALDE